MLKFIAGFATCYYILRNAQAIDDWLDLRIKAARISQLDLETERAKQKM